LAERHTVACRQLVFDSTIHNGRPASVISLQQLTTFAAVLPTHMDKDFAASALLPNESMLKIAAAPNAAATVNLWVLLKRVIFLLHGFAILFDRWPKSGKILLSRF
jgi:hypothetical protein